MTDTTGHPLNRTEVLSALLGDWGDLLIVTGLGSAANDMAALTNQADNVFTMDGVMGAATSVGLGLALAQPDHRVVVVTGDGELLMNVGSLATVAVQQPQNLAILCLDNGVYGLTGGQPTHTSFSTDLAAVATGAGIPFVATVNERADLGRAVALLRGTGPVFVLAKVAPGDTLFPGLERNGETLRQRFRRSVASREASS